MKTNTELLCAVLGWQGGTVHQVAKETGLTVTQIVESDRVAIAFDYTENSRAGWFAARTCSLEYNRAKIFPKRQGDLSFWMGAARGKEIG